MIKRMILLLAAASCVTVGAEAYLLRNVTVHPVSGPKLDAVSVLIEDGKIADIGAKVRVSKTAKVIEGKGLHVYPGMMDSATEVGISEIGSIRETSDTTELGDFNPQLRASIVVNPSSEHIPVTRANGITSVMVLPGGAATSMGFGFGSLNPVITGQASLMRLDGWTWEEMEIKRAAAMQLKFPVIRGMPARLAALAAEAGMPRSNYADAKRTYDRQIQQMHEFVENCRRYQKAKAARDPDFKPDLRLEAMIPVLEGKLPLMVTAARARAVREALVFAEKEKLPIVLAGIEELDPELTASIKKAGVPVIVGPTLDLPNEDDDPYDQKPMIPVELHRAGIKFAFGTFNTQFARNLPYQAATAVAFGLPYEEALKAVTLAPAEIWGVADQCGSVDKGKSADLIVTDGDPLETATQIKHMFIKGRAVDLSSKHTKLYEKYMARP